MKRILSLFMLLLLCIIAIACGNGQTTATLQTSGQTTAHATNNNSTSTNNNNTSGTTTGTTVAYTTRPNTVDPQQRPDVFPVAPDELTERVRYECGVDGFYIIKEYFDDNGNCLEEHYYTIDSELGILDCKIVAYNTVDAKGNLIKSDGHYIAHPYHAVRETVLVIEAIEHEKYDYKVLDENGNVTLYVKETKNANGKVTREEFFTKGGRFVRAEERDYRNDGTLSAYRGKNAKNELTYETLCNEKGNFLSSTVYDEAGRVNTKLSAEYYANGVIKAYKITPVRDQGMESVTDFDDKGRIKQHYGKEYRYDNDGKLKEIYHQGDSYKFDKSGYLLSYSGRANGQLGTSISIKYTYYNNGKISSCVTQNTKNGSKATVNYLYAEDGSATVRHTNVYGITNNIIYTDAKGRVIKSEVYNNVSRTSYQTVEYDVYGNVIKVCDYRNDKLQEEYVYEYNEHGDLVKMESSTGTGKEYTEYEYFENGYVKSVTSRDRWGVSGKTVYYTDGGYTRTTYSMGKESNEITYDKYGNKIKTVYFGNDYNEITEYEFYPDGTEKKVMLYHNTVLYSGVEYAEGGVQAIKRYNRGEDGVLTLTEYKYENGQISREDVYKNDVYKGYVTFTYFAENPHIVKTRTEYDANGKKVYYLENAESFTPGKEEFYEKGELVSYVYITYINFEGRLEIDTKEELKDGKTKKVDYDYNLNGKITGCTFFENGEKVSSSNYIYDENGYPRRITEYDTNGNVIEIRENDTNGNLEEMYRYEYHSNGTLKIMSKWKEYFNNPEVMVEKTVYNESGDIVLEEWYDRYSAVTKKCSYVYFENGKLEYIETESKGTVSRKYFRYGEDGKLLKTETSVGGTVTEYTDFIYYENGILKEELTYSVSKDRQEGIKTYDEYGRLVKECGRLTKGINTTEYVWGDEYTYIYGEDGRVAEKCHKNINNINLWIERYEYHENGEVSVRKTFWKDADGNERVNNTEYFDENGYKVYR